MSSFSSRITRSLALVCLLSPALAQAQTSLSKAWTVLNSGLEDKKIENRQTAVRLLGMLPGNDQAPALAIKALSDEDSDVREAATEALTSLKAPGTKDKLRDIIQTDKDPAVVLGAARALLAMNDPFGYGVFYAVLTGEKKSGEGLMEDQKKMLKDPKKLTKFGFEQGVGFVPFGGIGLTLVKSLTKDDVSPVRAAAAKILAADPDVKSLAALEEATGDNSWIVQVAAIAAIAQRNDQTTVSTLELRLTDPKEAVQYTAAAAIIHLNDVKDVKSEKPAPAKRPRR
jgi:HEAT repeat protein